MAPQKGAKQQKKIKDPKDKRAKSMESRDERVALLGPSVRGVGCFHSLGCHVLGVLKGACHHPRRGPRANFSPPPQRHGGP